MTALTKLAGGRAVEREMDELRVAQDEKEGEELFAALVELFGSHPFIQNRVMHLRSFASSAQYRSSQWWKNFEGKRK
jgi:hypothetical protein